MSIPEHRGYPSYKGRFPFRVGCTSYVFPDDILPNVRAMAPVVDDIELVLFESAENANLPLPAHVEELGELARKHALSFTVHFPLDRRACAADRRESDAFVAQCHRIVTLCEPLRPYGYILHLEGRMEGGNETEIHRWRSAAERVCDAVAEAVSDRGRVCVENLGYDWRLHRDLVERYGFSLCLDIGHLWLYERNWRDACREMLPRTRVVHLHGLEQGRDHVSLARGPLDDTGVFVALLKESRYNRLVTLEVFSENDTFESLARLERAWHA
ncbi:MAG: TIM barrel protein [Chitinivibrionales bacterium]|nr:TIM barrel protein [Chitinivibrionales bacterium]